MYTVYKHTAPNGKAYIGITKQAVSARWKNGNGYKSSPHFYSAILKYGWENIEHIILHTDLSEEEACEYEKYYIKIYKTYDPKYGYNNRMGGEKGASFTEETERRRRIAMREYWSKPESRQAASERMKGRKHTEEAKRKMSRSKTGLKIAPHTEEWKSLMRDIMREKYAPDSELYKANSERLIRIGKAKAQSIEQLDMNGEIVAIYESAHEAEEKTGISNGNIRRVCNGKSHTAGGYKWRNSTENISRQGSL